MKTRLGAVLLIGFGVLAGHAESREVSLLDRMPSASALRGTLVTTPARYDREHLWVELNGAASQYEEYGCLELVTARYEIDGAQLIVQLFDQGLSLNAFGLFRQLRDAGGRAVDLAGEAVIGDSDLLFRQGRFVVSILLADPGARAPALLERVGRVVSLRLPRDPVALAALDILPPAALAGSEVYLPRNALGYGQLGPVVGASFVVAGDTCRVHIARQASTAQADSALTTLAADLTSQTLVSNLGRRAVVGLDPYYGPSALIVVGTHLIVAHGLPQPDSVGVGFLRRCVQHVARLQNAAGR